MNIQKMMKQAQAMQKKMEEAQEKLSDAEFTGTSGGGMVSVIISGKGQMLKLNIDNSLVDPDETEVLEDLILAAFNNAKKEADDASSDTMSSMAGDMGLPPGFKLPF